MKYIPNVLKVVSLVFASSLVVGCQADPPAPEVDPPSGPETSPEPDESCKAPGLGCRPFEELPTKPKISNKDLVPDGIKVDTLSFKVRGSRGKKKRWDLKKKWTGRDNYVFVTYYPKNVEMRNAWKSPTTKLDKFFSRSADNTQYFFGVVGVEEVDDDLDILEAKVENALSKMPTQKSEELRKRLNFIATPLQDIDGIVGELVKSKRFGPMWGFGIGRDQRLIRFTQVTALAPPGSIHPFVSDVNGIGYYSTYMNYLFDTYKQIEEMKDYKEITLFDNLSTTFDQKHSPGETVATVTFPSKAEMQQYNKMEVIVESQCGPTMENCAYTDYEAYLQWCKTDACKENREFVRWITPYPLAAKKIWTTDASPYLPLFKEGGTQYVRFGMLWYYNTGTYKIRLRLYKEENALKPVEIIPLFAEGKYRPQYGKEGTTYDYNQLPKFSQATFTPPADVKKVEIVSLITGHGDNTNKCSEWCAHQHHFTLNGTKEYLYDSDADHLLLDVATLRNLDGCAKQIAKGVPPNQGGNWEPGRAGWCPGLMVQPNIFDITANVNKGAANTIDYRSDLRGDKEHERNLSKDPAAIRFNAYIVYYK